MQNSTLFRETVLPNFKQASENRFSWRIRFAVAENAAQLAGYVSQEAVEEDILGFYELLLRDSEAEVRSEAVAQVPLIAKHCQSYIFVDRILPIIREQIANDNSQHVKGSMAQAICDMSESLNKQDTINFIIPTITSILKDSVTEVRVSLLQNLTKLVKSLTDEEIANLIVPEIQRLSTDKTWRIRLSTISICPSIPDYLSKEKFTELIEPILLNWLEDSVHEVRMEAVICIVKLKDNHFGSSWLEGFVAKKLEQLHRNTRFGLRIHTLFMVNELQS